MELLNSNEVSKILKITKRTLYRYIKDGIIPHIRLQKRIRFRKEDIDQFIHYRLMRTQEVEDVLRSIKNKIRRELNGS